MLSAATSSGEEIYFEWLSPQSMKIKHKYTVYDLPCSSNRAQTEVSQVFDWSNPSADFIDLENSLHRINKEYLKEVTEAAGFPFDDLFIDASESPESDMKKLVRVQKLYELQERNIRAELLSCASERENHPPIGDNPPSSGGNYSFFGI
jgi:hypothetical protein